MSSIYGILMPVAEPDPVDAEAMKQYNRLYGSDHCSFSGKYFVMGTYVEHFLPEIQSPKHVLRSGNRVAVLDTLLFNREELLPLLPEGTAPDISDEELLLALLETEGTDILHRVNGDFAGAVYDEESHTLTLFRDHMGIRPLYFYADKEKLAFSTDIRGLTAMPDADVSVNEKQLYLQCAGFNANDLTSTDFSAIRCVKPHSVLTVAVSENGFRFREKDYWRLGRHKIRFGTDEEYFRRMRELVTDAIQCRMNAMPGRVGAELSGGLDSSVISILINRLGRGCKYVSWRVVPDDWPIQPEDERSVIASVCRQEGITCDFLPEYKNRPTRDATYVPPVFENTLSIGETAQCMSREGIRCVFTGQGGDEGVSHRSHALELFHHHEYAAYFRDVAAGHRGQKLAALRTLRSIAYQILVRYPAYFRPKKFNDAGKKVFTAGFLKRMKKVKGNPFLFAIDPIRETELGGQRLRNDTAAYLGAENGARYLFPFEDYRVFDFAVSIPRRLYRKGNVQRYIYRQAFENLMPEELRQVDYKDYPSLRNEQPSVQRDPEERKRKMKELVQALDRERWKNIIDFEQAEKWAETEWPEEKDRRMELHLQYITLNHCLLIQKNQNISKKS